MRRKKTSQTAPPDGEGLRRRKPRRRRTVVLCLVLLTGVSLAGSLAMVPRLLSSGQRQVASGPPWDLLAHCRVTPQYDRRLKKVLICLRGSSSSLALHHEILARLPQYSQIILLMPRTNLRAIQSDLQDKAYGDRVRFVVYDSEPRQDLRFYLVLPDKDQLVKVNLSRSYGVRELDSVWAQDLFVVTTSPAGGLVLLLPCVQKYFSTVGGDREQCLVADNVCLDDLSREGLEIQRLPLAFRGGNILADEIGGRRVALIGCDTFRISRASSQALVGPALSESAVTSYLRKALNVDEAIVIGGPQPQPEQMFHLDQAVMLLHGGVAAVTRIVGPLPDAPADARRIIEAKQFLSGLRRALAGVGYRLVDIDTSVRNVLSFEHYINAIPYVDAVSGRRTILMPVFPSGQTDSDRQLVRRNSQTLRSLGYKVVHVPTRANEMNGGIHCLVNVLE